jgi:hypothetical protein
LECFSGAIENVRIYNRALTASEVKAQYESYNSQINLNSSPTNTIAGGSINQGLVGYWPFNGNVKDATPYGNNATVNNASLTSDRKGRANSAYAFSTSPSYLNIAPTLPYGSFVTVSAWVKQNTLALHGIVQHQFPTSNGGWILQTDASGSVAFAVYLGGAQYVAQCPASTMNTTAWHHLAGTYDGTTLLTYFDGVQCGTATQAGAAVAAGSTVIGGSGGSPVYSIDEVRIYDRAISSTEVQSLYQSGD